MDLVSTDSTLFTMVILPLLIFLARVVDVSIGTVRLIFIARGMKLLAPILGFVEVLVWIVAIGQIMQNLTAPIYYIAYAGGFAAGTFVGMQIEQRLALGIVSLRIITRRDATELIDVLREKNYGVTNVLGEGSTGPVNVIYTLVKRIRLGELIELIKHYNPNAFYIVEDIRFAQEGVFPPSKSKVKLWHGLHLPRMPLRK
ncbi:DUF2179 domain-containing protein [bacterium]|nr:DUF2179 domain-containing protein [bacterium]